MKRLRKLHLAPVLAGMAVFGFLTYSTIAQNRLNAALISSAEKGDCSEMKRLLSRGADPNSHLIYTNSIRDPVDLWSWIRRDKSIFWHDAPLVVQMASYGGPNDLAVVSTLLDAGADVNARDHMGRSALIDAAGADRPEMVLLLLQRGADPDAHTPNGVTALKEALHYQRPRVIDVLRRHAQK